MTPWRCSKGCVLFCVLFWWLLRLVLSLLIYLFQEWLSVSGFEHSKTTTDLIRSRSGISPNVRDLGIALRPMQTDATLLGPTCCVRLHGTPTMLALVAYSLKPVKLLGPCKRTQHFWPKTPNNTQQCCDLLRPFAWTFRFLCITLEKQTTLIYFGVGAEIRQTLGMQGLSCILQVVTEVLWNTVTFLSRTATCPKL